MIDEPLINGPLIYALLSRSAFAPLYGNQYAGQQSNQYWSNSGYPTGSNSSSLLNKNGNNDMDGMLHNNNRKEKRQYKKRKHKNQREKQPSSMFENHNTENIHERHELVVDVVFLLLSF